FLARGEHPGYTTDGDRDEFTGPERSQGFLNSRFLSSKRNGLAEKVVVNVQHEGLIKNDIFRDAG
ncbi:MAG TPA: hypothetical protein VK638_37580, partial [Edaphobacter sp.]|nr:hypothetical protein [Edaphobacter sp.]